MSNEKIYDKNVVKKPWGFEYVIYRNKDLCITYLNINKQKKTSLHNHIKKKTGFLVLSGVAHIQLGLYKSQIKKYISPNKVMIRPGLFHQIFNKSKSKDLIALEFESPTGKQDLIRFEDIYGRSKKKYEGSSSFKDIKKPLVLKSLNKFKSQKFKVGSIKVNFKSSKKLKLSNNQSTIYSLIDGKIVNNFNKSVLPLGDLIKTGTIKKLLNKFKIKSQIKYIEVFK